MKNYKDYKVIIIKKYELELDGTSKKDIFEQVEYILSKHNILELPEVKKKQNLIIKRIHKIK